MTRLSAIQKWVLANCLNTANQGRQDMYKYGFLFTSEIVDKFGGANKAEVTVSRSLRGMIGKGLIVGFTPRKIIDKKLTQANPADLIHSKNPIKLDIATLEAMKVKPEERTKERIIEFENKLARMEKEHGKNASLISPVRYKHETIKLITLTDLGFKTTLMLSNSKTTKLNNNNLLISKEA